MHALQYKLENGQFKAMSEKQVKRMPTILVGWAAARAESGAGSLTSKRIMDTFIQTLS